MSNFEFEGDLQGVSEGQLEYIGNVLQERGYKSGKVLFEAVGKAGKNYGANVQRIVVKKDGSTFKMVAKIAPIIESVRNMLKTDLLFRNEHYMYTEVLPKFLEMLKAAKVPESERLRYATCYGTNIEAPNEVILLEELSDCVMLDTFKSFTDETVKLVLKNVAILHSLSYALKHQEPETYEEYKRKIVNIREIYYSRRATHMWLEQYEEKIQLILDNDYYKNRIKGHISNFADIYSENDKIDNALKYSVMVHTDLWTNNIMFRIENDKPMDCIMIDYQMSRHGCPVSDIHYMIFNCTDYQTRSKHYHDWIDYYYSELGRNLAIFGLQVKNVYPRKQFDADLKRCAKQYFSTALLAIHFQKRTEEAAVDEDAMKKAVTGDEYQRSTNREENTLKIKNIIEGLIDSFVELGYIL